MSVNCNFLSRHYTIDDRAALRDVGSDDWEEVYSRYLRDLHCPLVTTNTDVSARLIYLCSVGGRRPAGDLGLAGGLCRQARVLGEGGGLQQLRRLSRLRYTEAGVRQSSGLSGLLIPRV